MWIVDRKETSYFSIVQGRWVGPDCQGWASDLAEGQAIYTMGRPNDEHTYYIMLTYSINFGYCIAMKTTWLRLRGDRHSVRTKINEILYWGTVAPNYCIRAAFKLKKERPRKSSYLLIKNGINTARDFIMIVDFSVSRNAVRCTYSYSFETGEFAMPVTSIAYPHLTSRLATRKPWCLQFWWVTSETTITIFHLSALHSICIRTNPSPRTHSSF